MKRKNELALRLALAGLVGLGGLSLERWAEAAETAQPTASDAEKAAEAATPAPATAPATETATETATTATEADAPADGEYVLGNIVMESQRPRLAGGLVTPRQHVGLLGDKDVMETPFQAMTFESKAMDMFALPDRNIIDVLSFSPSVRVGMGPTDSNVTIRGMNSNGNQWYINGVPGMAHQKDMTANFVESATVISGPALGVRGTTASWQENAGGIVDLISKKATMKGTHDVKLGFSGRGYFSQAIDYGERFGKDKEWGARLNILHGEGELSADDARMWKWGAYLDIDHKTAHSTTNLLMGYDWTRQRGDGNSLSIPSFIRALPHAPRGDINFSPSWAEDTYNDWTIVLNHDQKLGQHLSFFLNAGYHRENYTSWIQGYSRALLDMDGNYGSLSSSGYGSGYSQWPVAHTTKYAGIGLRGDFTVGGWRNDYVLSHDRMWFIRKVIGNYGTEATDIYLPALGNIYHTNSAPLTAPFPKHSLKTQYNLRTYGWHVVDTITSPNKKLGITIGVHGHRGIRARNYAGSTSSEIDAHATCPTYAITYSFTPKFMMYANHSESFDEGTVVGSGYKNAGETIPPAKTKQNEVGMKWQNGSVLQTLSFYRIKKQGTNDILAADGSRYLALDKSQKYKGLEYSAVGSLSKKWDAIVALNWIEAEQTNGTSVLGLPKWAGTMALVYKPTQKWDIIGRLNYRGDSVIRHSDGLTVPSVTTFDLGVNYRTKVGKEDVTFSLMCNNLFDRHYWYTSSGSSSIYLGMPRTISLSANFML